ncbi:DUF3305 domain-containing protein [Roseobacter sp.]|uniref:DUF3305 domain-containing protein n=1 Tax=Roseobacter sp. TaxID=1907202 RepID=UPI0032974FA7
MSIVYPNSESIRLGVVMRRAPGVTPWAKWVWSASAVLPGAGEASWKLLRDEESVSEFHAATHDLWLYVSDAEAYAHELQAETPSVYIILRETDQEDAPHMPLDVLKVSASPYEAQDYSDSGEELVERVAMPRAVLAWVSDFVAQHYRDEPFVKRRRDKHRTARTQDGIGDARIAQVSDVYRVPAASTRETSE